MPLVLGAVRGLAFALAMVLPVSVAARAALIDIAVGADDAPVTIIEYASLTCPHCADFHNQTFGALYAEYIDTGHVRLIYRDYPFDQVALEAAMLARCAGEERFFGMIETLFAQQDNWAKAPDPREGLAKVARLAGIGKSEFDACLADKSVESFILSERLEGEKEFGVKRTPTFVIGTNIYEGFKTIAEMRDILDPPLRQAGIEVKPPAQEPQAGETPAPETPSAEPAETGPGDGQGRFGTWALLSILVIAVGVGAYLYSRRGRKT
jgi:protein-disulfide isomerase